MIENDFTQHVLLNGVVSYNFTNNKNQNKFFVSSNRINNFEHKKNESFSIVDEKVFLLIIF